MAFIYRVRWSGTNPRTNPGAASKLTNAEFDDGGGVHDDGGKHQDHNKKEISFSRCHGFDRKYSGIERRQTHSIRAGPGKIAACARLALGRAVRNRRNHGRHPGWGPIKRLKIIINFPWKPAKKYPICLVAALY
ncbi:MAG: hypothetical protein QGH73_08275 [Rhodospirillales bacterium]|nr:hypothetical protein [Rhodospirillales bacterium]